MAEPKYRASCDTCLNSKVKCSQTKPACERCMKHGQECAYSQYRKIGRPSTMALASPPDRRRQQQQQQQQQKKPPKKQQPRAQQTRPDTNQERVQPAVAVAAASQRDNDDDGGDDDGNSNFQDVFMRANAVSSPQAALLPASPGAPPARQEVCEDSQVGSSALFDWASVSPMSRKMPDPDFDMINFDDFEIDLQDTNWADLSSIIDSTAVLPSTPLPPCPTPQRTAVQAPLFPHIDTASNGSEANFFATSITSPFPSSDDSQVPADSATLVTAAAALPSSSDSAHHHPSSASYSSSSPPPQSHAQSVFSQYASSARQLPPSPPRHTNDHQGRAETHSSRPLFFRRSSPTSLVPYSASSSSSSSAPSCDFQCQVALTDQLNYFSECQADNNTHFALDVLLNLDDYVRQERDRILCCTVCLGKSRRDQTLMLTAMVAGKLFSLFDRERERAADRPCASSSSGSSSSSNGSSRGSSGPSSRLGSVLSSALCSSTLSSRNSSVSVSGSGAASSLPHTPRPLTIGQVQLDDEVKTACSRQLLRMYLERQKSTVRQLDHLLAEAEGSDVVCKVTRELLADLSRGAQYFLGILALTDGLESDPLVHRRVLA